MRKGHDFHKGKGGGKLSNPRPMRKNIHVSPLFVYPTTFIAELLLVVEAVIVFGSGVAGLSILTHTHTPPQRLISQWKRNLHALSTMQASRFSVYLHAQDLPGFHSRGHILLSTPKLNTHAHPIHVLSVSYPSTCEL